MRWIRSVGLYVITQTLLHVTFMFHTPPKVFFFLSLQRLINKLDLRHPELHGPFGRDSPAVNGNRVSDPVVLLLLLLAEGSDWNQGSSGWSDGVFK